MREKSIVVGSRISPKQYQSLKDFAQGKHLQIATLLKILIQEFLDKSICDFSEALTHLRG